MVGTNGEEVARGGAARWGEGIESDEKFKKDEEAELSGKRVTWLVIEPWEGVWEMGG